MFYRLEVEPNYALRQLSALTYLGIELDMPVVKYGDSRRRGSYEQILVDQLDSLYSLRALEMWGASEKLLLPIMEKCPLLEHLAIINPYLDLFSAEALLSVPTEYFERLPKLSSLVIHSQNSSHPDMRWIEYLAARGCLEHVHIVGINSLPFQLACKFAANNPNLRLLCVNCNCYTSKEYEEIAKAAGECKGWEVGKAPVTFQSLETKARATAA